MRSPTYGVERLVRIVQQCLAMPRVCTVCSHPERDAINEAIVAGQVKRRIATQFKIGEKAVRDHAEAHLPERLLQASRAAEIVSADSLVLLADDLYQRARTLVNEAKADDGATALRAIGEARATLELLVRLRVQVDQHLSRQQAQVFVEHLLIWAGTQMEDHTFTALREHLERTWPTYFGPTKIAQEQARERFRREIGALLYP